MKVIFMGTPEFGRRVLEYLINVTDVVLVVTQPDQVQGRKREVTFSPVKQLALEHHLPVFQPERIRRDYQVILDTPCDFIVTAAYGQIIGTKVLNHPKYKALNVHGSLLPKYRGGAPIQRAIANGDETTGISIMEMVAQMDAGDVYLQYETPILDKTTSDLFRELGDAGGKLVYQVMQDIISNKIEAVPQDESLVTFAYNLERNEEQLNFNQPAFLVKRQIQALSEEPGAFFHIDNNRIKVYNCILENQAYSALPGTIVRVERDSFTVACQAHAVKFTEVQPAGRRLMTVRDYLNGAGSKIIVNSRRIHEN